MIIDAHAHLWVKQQGRVNGGSVHDIGSGRSMFGGEVRQMMPPYMTDGVNSAERFLANMDYAGVSGAVITQEYIDGNQDAYLRQCRTAFADRLRVCALYEEQPLENLDGFDGIKLCAGRLDNQDLLCHLAPFELANAQGKFISIDLADGSAQTGALREIAQQFPDLRIAIGHFGMVTRDGWLEQIRLAQLKNVFIESGGITWLFHKEFYPYPSAVRAIREAADLVGFDKLMWGSDYPRTMTAITYKMSLDFVQKTPEITQADKSLFLGENARSFYAFPDLPIPQRVRNMVEDD
ncbi:MAG: amidohydrolase [Ruminococcaceae bacterium]|nr:amidohydrolase [Oscillospiraceae bacterium]